MEVTQKMGFGYIDDNSEDLQTKIGGKFGLNQGFLTKFEFNPNAGKDGTPSNAIDIEVQVGDKVFRSRYYEVTKVFGKDGEITDVNSPEYISKFNETMTQLSASIVHIVKAFRTDEEVRTALATPPTSFSDWAKIMQSLIPSTANTTPIDVFLEYQWEIKENQNQTFLQLPTNMKGGRWISKLVEGPWEEDKTNGLKYRNPSGLVHPFERSVNYMESNKAIQQREGSATGSIDGSTAKSSTW